MRTNIAVYRGVRRLTRWLYGLARYGVDILRFGQCQHRDHVIDHAPDGTPYERCFDCWCIMEGNDGQS
jgi:hypothetical protein